MNDQLKTKKQLAEEVSRLEERLDLFQGLVENSPDAIVMLDAHGAFTYFSPGAEALSGYTAAETLGMHITDFFPGGLEEARENMRRLRAEGQLRNHQMGLKIKDGRLIEIITSISLLRDAEGGISGTIGVWKDVTEQRRAEEALRRGEERSDALYRVSNQLAGAHDTDELLDLIVNESARLLDATGAYIRLLEVGGMAVKTATESASAFINELSDSEAAVTRVEAGTSGSGQALATKRPMVSEDSTKDKLVSPEGRRLAEKHGFHGLVLTPLVANGRSIGVLAVIDNSIRRFTEDEVSLLEAFADQAALALEKARLLNEAKTEKQGAETERERADSLYRVSNLLAGAHDTDEVLDLIVNEAARLVGATAAWIRLLEGDFLVLAGAATESVAGFLAEDAVSRPSISVADQATVMAKAVASKKPIVVEDASKDLSIEEVRLRVQKYGFHGFAVVPLLANRAR